MKRNTSKKRSRRSPYEPRSVICTYCGKIWSYEAGNPKTPLAKIVVEVHDHESQCPKNPHLAEINRLKRALECPSQPLTSPEPDLRSPVICPDALDPGKAFDFVNSLIRMQTENGAKIVGVTRELIVDGVWHRNPTGHLFQLIFKKEKPPASEDPNAYVFLQRIRNVINACSMENGSDTPDFILAHYLCACLRAFNTAVSDREQWYGRGAKPSALPAPCAPPTPRPGERDE